MRQLTMNDKILNFNTFHISVIIYISLDEPSSAISQLDEIQKEFI